MKGYKDAEVLRAAYAEHRTLEAVADHFGVSKRLILRHMQRFGIPRNPTTKAVDAWRAAEMLESGETMQAAATVAGVASGTLRARLKAAGVVTDRYHTGRTRTWHGYVLLLRPDHHRANSKGYVGEHTLAAEAKIGRPLRDDEVVHHINGRKDDNRPENLQVMGKWEHKSHHSSQPRGPRRRKI